MPGRGSSTAPPPDRTASGIRYPGAEANGMLATNRVSDPRPRASRRAIKRWFCSVRVIGTPLKPPVVPEDQMTRTSASGRLSSAAKRAASASRKRGRSDSASWIHRPGGSAGAATADTITVRPNCARMAGVGSAPRGNASDIDGIPIRSSARIRSRCR